MTRFLTDTRNTLGDTVITRITVFDDYAMATRPVAGSGADAQLYYFRGGYRRPTPIPGGRHPPPRRRGPPRHRCAAGRARRDGHEPAAEVKARIPTLGDAVGLDPSGSDLVASDVVSDTVVGAAAAAGTPDCPPPRSGR